mgnify:CR=1 FL=1|tara:strand:- start:353 stop:550 length:198 start_codon:yes stop_codon:yes gene_type:complete
MIVRVYKDIYVDDSEEENYEEVAIDVAIGFLGDWDVEIIQEPEKPKTTEEHFDQCLRKWGGNGKR